MPSNKYTLCSGSGEPWNLRYLFVVFQTTHVFVFWFGVLKMKAIFLLFRKMFWTRTWPLSCQWIQFVHMVLGWEQQSCNDCDILKVPWRAQLPFGGHWDLREPSATTLLLYIYIAHFIQKDNKGISQVLDTYHHWNVDNVALEGGEQILHGSQQTHWGRQCFGYNSSITHLLV